MAGAAGRVSSAARPRAPRQRRSRARGRSRGTSPNATVCAKRTNEEGDFGQTCRGIRAGCANTLRGMDMDALLTLISLVSFLALVLMWLAAPMRAPEPALIAV